MQKFKVKTINARPGAVIIVGQCPGRQRLGQQTSVAWEGNRSADLVLRAINGMDNLVLTNACNYQKLTVQGLKEGRKDLQEVMDIYQPRRVICLGNLAREQCNKLQVNTTLAYLTHPSYVIRFFNLRQQAYVDKLRKIIKEAHVQSI